MDQDGIVRDNLVQTQRDAKAAKCFFRLLLKGPLRIGSQTQRREAVECGMGDSTETDAWIGNMKYGHTHLAETPKHARDLDTAQPRCISPTRSTSRRCRARRERSITIRRGRSLALRGMRSSNLPTMRFDARPASASGDRNAPALNHDFFTLTRRSGFRRG